MQPFLKWPGGKRWLTIQNEQIFPRVFNHYYEPFLGSGAVFFSLLPEHSTISDLNQELINLYIVMRDYPKQLQEIMRQHNTNHSSIYYYTIREHEPEDLVERAGRTLYLNRTCYNGMYRVNKQGMFNVPIGTKTNCIYDVDSFEAYSKALLNSDLLSCDFALAIAQAGEGDLVFADPPYTMAKGSGFIKYNQALFTWNDQLRLHAELSHARDRGAYIVLTNANCQEIRDLYGGNGFVTHNLNRNSTMSGQVRNRGVIEELVITSF